MRIRVVGAAIERDGQTFAARRSASMSEPLRWEFPGGKVEAGETDAEALARELVEELGVEIEVGAAFGAAEVTRGDRQIELVVYAATLLRGEPTPSEHDDAGFFDDDTLATLDWAEADVPIVRRWLAAKRSLRAAKR
jgi:8-oxo-dGTP diphosphatase